MAYNTKPIVTDKDGNPISQYYNPDTDSYEPVEGANGANKVLVVNNDLSLIPILEKLSQLTGSVIDEETRKQNETTRQNNEQERIQLYNNLLAELERIEQIDKQVPESVLEAINALRDELGNLEDLETIDKSSIINAINEVNTKIDEIEIIDMDAENVSYDNTESGLISNNVQTAINEVYADLTSHKAENVQQYEELKYSELSSTATNIDSEGIYKNIEWKRKDNTIYAKSTLIGTYPYPQIKIDYYDEDGTTIVKTITWDLTYDDNDFPYVREVI